MLSKYWKLSREFPRFDGGAEPLTPGYT
jgi:hypothetical protein